jgi:hypothetical protein
MEVIDVEIQQSVKRILIPVVKDGSDHINRVQVAVQRCTL